MINISSEDDSYIVAIQKVISYMSDCLRILKFVVQTRQDAKCKATEKLKKETKELKTTIGDFISVCFDLTSNPGKSKILPSDLDHTVHKREIFFFLSLQVARTILLPSSNLL